MTTTPRLPYLHTVRSRGRLYHRYRRGGRVIRLAGEPGSAEFAADYARLHAQFEGRAAPARDDRVTIAEAVAEWMRSTEWKSLSPVTHRAYRSNLSAWLDAYGRGYLDDVERRHVKAWIAERHATPSAANNMLRRLRQIFAFAVEEGWIAKSPAEGVRGFKIRGGYHSWTEAEVAQYEARWTIGTTQRLGLALLLYTGQRRGDVAAMTWGAIKDGRLEVRQQKTGARVSLPLHRDLRAILDATERRATTILATDYGRPFSTEGFGHRFGEWCDAAGLPPKCRAHGLRKACATRLAEAGCSTEQIKSIGGWSSTAEVERYTRAANQARLADAAVEKLETWRNRTERASNAKADNSAR